MMDGPWDDRRYVPARRAELGVGYPGYPGYKAPNEAREMLAMLRRHVWLIVVCGILGTAAAGYRVATEVPQYRATATVRLADVRGALTGGMGDAAMERSVGGLNDPLLSQIEILRSRAHAEAVVERVSLQLLGQTPALSREALGDIRVSEAAGFDTLELRFTAETVELSRADGERIEAPYGGLLDVGDVAFSVASHPGVGEATLVVVPRDVAIRRVQDRLTARPRDRTDIIDLDFTDPDPILAQSVVNAAADVFRIENMRSAQQQSRRRREFIEEQLAKTDSQVSRAQLDLTGFRSSEHLYNSGERLAAQQVELMQLDLRRGELEADLRMYRSLLREIRGAGPEVLADQVRTLMSAPGIASNPAVASLFTQLVGYQMTIDSLTTGVWRRSETHPDVQRLRQLVASTSDHLADAVQSQIGFLDARLAALDQLKRRQTASIELLPQRQAEEVYLEQQLQTLQSISNQLRQELQRARITEAVEAGQVEIVDLATLPADPLDQGRGRTILFGLVIGLALGGIGAQVRERLDTSINRHDEIEPLLQVPNLAVIPRIAGNERGALGFRTRLLDFRRPGGRRRVPARDLVTVVERRSSGAEAYRTLRTNLIFSPDRDPVRSLVVTSAGEAEGKTTTAANLAVSLAQQGSRVLLVDGDMRRPRVHRLFGVPAHPGLSDLLSDPTRATNCVVGTSVPGLHVLSAGTLAQNPSELLGSPRMRQVIGTMKEGFDILVFDSPPLLATADGSILGAQVDGVLLVIRAGDTDRFAGLRAVEQLEGVGAHVLGAVLNDPDGNVPRYTYSGAYDHLAYRWDS